MSSSSPYFSLVILCYRGEESVIPFIEKVHSALSKYNYPWEIILVGNYWDRSTDRTPDIVEGLALRLPNIRSVTKKKEGMMGWDMQQGLAIANGTYIGIMDGDAQFPMEAIFSCLAYIETEGFDLVKTYRVSRNDGLYRFFISTIYNLIFNILFGSGLRDVNAKPKIIRRDAFRRMSIQSTDWFIDAEIMINAKEMGLKIGEIPTHFYAQVGRGSFVKLSAIWEFICNLAKARSRMKVLRRRLDE